MGCRPDCDVCRVRTTLVKTLRRVDQIVAERYEQGIVSQYEKDRIVSQPITCKKVETLLDLICATQRDNVYHQLLLCLKNTNQMHLCTLLTDKGRKLISFTQT